MPSVLSKLRFARWGRSVYETESDIAAEKKLISSLVEVTDDVSTAHIIAVHSKMKVDAAFLKAAPNVQWVIATTSGYDHLDLGLLQKHAVLASRMPLVRRDAVVQSSLSMLLQATRRHHVFQQQALLGHWARGDLSHIQPKNLAELHIGVVGYGVIGRQMVKLLQELGASVSVCDPAGVPEHVRSLPFSVMAERCDAVTFHCNLNSSNHGMVNESWLLSCKPGMIIINTSRGKVIDLKAAIEALDKDQIGYLAVDVFPSEPYQHLTAIRSRPNLFFSPHASGYHGELPRLIREGLRRDISLYVQGEKPSFVL